ncbi:MULTISPECIES: HAD family hydrolase [unclassified Rhizobium]|uniref:HAD-IA family hydrolase n=1 Tax=unclassified Rhizobium TaxID=2613769 RepID=UPI00160AF2E5|nr:putative hydrolase of the HAD superfamily [Rhizobium sp. BK098]MBB3618709.1 putative hydrolase of the HAD superfamily [Rhizobium sp. BK609]MBB3684417.1 putative hydrolase of the HAD superfamily [Rhizobium sp. BK612]
MVIKAILFDLDETLLDRRSTAAEFLQMQYRELVAGQFGDALSQDQYAARYFKLEEEGLVKKSDLYPALVASFGLPAELSGPLLNHFRLRYPEMARPMNGAREALQTLRKVGLPCAIISNGEGGVQRKKIEVAGLADLIEFALISGEVGIRKPDRQIFEMAAERLGLLPSECVFVGDNPTADVLGALNAGMSAVYFGEIETWPLELPKPDYTCNSLGDVVALIATLE